MTCDTCGDSLAWDEKVICNECEINSLKAQIVEAADERAEAAEARVVELELALSTAHIKGMEEALEIVQYNSCPCCLRIAARIKELTP